MIPNQTRERQVIPLTFRDRAVRAVLIDGVPWFVAKDACDIVVSTLENQLSRAKALIATQDRIIQELRQHIQYQNSILGTNIGGHNEHCCTL